jgi:hypothetical protein
LEIALLRGCDRYARRSVRIQIEQVFRPDNSGPGPAILALQPPRVERSTSRADLAEPAHAVKTCRESFRHSPDSDGSGLAVTYAASKSPRHRCSVRCHPGLKNFNATEGDARTGHQSGPSRRPCRGLTMRDVHGGADTADKDQTGVRRAGRFDRDFTLANSVLATHRWEPCADLAARASPRRSWICVRREAYGEVMPFLHIRRRSEQQAGHFRPGWKRCNLWRGGESSHA